MPPRWSANGISATFNARICRGRAASTISTGHYNGALDYVTHVRDGGFDWHRDDKVSYDEGYSTHLLAQETVRLIREYGGRKPFFIDVSFNAVHAPLAAPDSYKQPYAHLKEPRRTFAGVLAAMDEAVGQIVAALDEKGLRQNTRQSPQELNTGPPRADSDLLAETKER